MTSQTAPYEVICNVEVLRGQSLASAAWTNASKATVTFSKDEMQFSAEASDLRMSLVGVRSIRLTFDFAQITFVPTLMEHDGEGDLVAATYRGLNSETSLVIFND